MQLFLYIGTMLIGIGVAHMNVLLPSVIRTYFPMKVGPMTSVFTFSMMLATAVGASLAAPITALTSWQIFVGLLTILLIGALLVWLPNERFAAKKASYSNKRVLTRKRSDSMFGKNRNAWLLLFFGGMQSAMFYVLMAWGPTMAIQNRINAGHRWFIFWS
jgi:MFS transporter, CP family, cyanate transporter